MSRLAGHTGSATDLGPRGSDLARFLDGLVQGPVCFSRGIRRRDSGNYQVRYRGPDGVMHAAPMTFERRSDAERWLTLLGGRIIRGEWSSPEGCRLVLADYAARWIRERRLQPRTRELYESQLRNHINL
jgi:hypothetical protein